MIRTIIADYTREGGVRGLKKALMTIARNVAAEIVKHETDLPRVVTADELDELLGRKIPSHDLLPEDKHAFVQELSRQGCNVIVVGDGVNDAPALAAADVGIAMGQGTAIAKEVADITLTDGDLSSVVRLIRLSRALSNRMDRTFYQVMGLNSAFLAAGIAGIITPQVSSLLHNATTIGLSLAASRP